MRIPRPRRAAGPRRTESLRYRLRGPWRIAIRQASMEPTLAEGDWLLLDPTTAPWPRRGSLAPVHQPDTGTPCRGSVGAFHQPDTGTLAVKRVAGTPGDRIPFREGYLELADDEAWLVSDADENATTAPRHGAPTR